MACLLYGDGSNLGMQLHVDGADMDAEDMRFEVLPHRLRLAVSKSTASKLPVPPGTPSKDTVGGTARHARTWSDSSRSAGPAALQDV